jgi:glycosyltransferase involved in cell wall biosynthesis
MTKLRVAWDDCFARSNNTGTGVYAARLSQQLANRNDLTLDVLNGWEMFSGRSGVASRALRTAVKLIWTHAYLPAVLWKRNFSVLHAPAFVAPIASPCPTVITLHDITYLLYPSHFASWWVGYMKSVMPLAVKLSAAVICGSENSKQDILRTYGIPSERVHVIPYGLDHERFRLGVTLDSTWARNLGIRAGYILHVGVFSQRKNIPVLLQAIAHLRSKGKWRNRQLVLAGSEVPGITGAAEIYDTISRLGLTESVILTGHAPDEHIPGLYANASALVMPSLYEGFGFPILESMAVGTPVVASNSSSLPEVAGDAAILVPPRDMEALAEAIERVIENRTIAEELRRKGLARARQFSWERTAEQTVAVYRSVANG